MKIGKYDITASNIKAYIQGNVRKLIDKHGMGYFELPNHIQEQIAFRELVANPNCLNDGFCKCNCILPDMFYADKTCTDECYPVMLNEQEWLEFKMKIDNLDLVIKYPFYKFWKKMDSKVKLEYNPELGTINRGEIVILKVKYEGALVSDIETSCVCTNITFDEEFITIEFDSSKKKADHLFTVSIYITWDDNSKSYIEFNGFNKETNNDEL